MKNRNKTFAIFTAVYYDSDVNYNFIIFDN